MFIKTACWIQGVYVYKQLLGKINNDIAYFGMPKNMEYDGFINGTEELCMVTSRFDAQTNENCVPMEKTFFLQVCIIYYNVPIQTIVIDPFV